MDVLAIILACINIALTLAMLTLLVSKLKCAKKNTDDSNMSLLKERIAVIDSAVNRLREEGDRRQSQLRGELSGTISGLGSAISDIQKQSADMTARQLSQLEIRLQGLEKNNLSALAEIRTVINRQLTEIKEDNGKRLDEIRTAVDEKLQTALEERMTRSFRAVGEQLEAVYKGLGEMQTLANGVGDLKRVLSNVKARGILGEIQLGAILGEILTPEQYDTEVATIPDSAERVEFAVKLPAENGTVYLPIDSKFPGDAYAALQNAYDSADKAQVDIAAKTLCARLKQFAKDISEKYVMPPYTTNFAVMFLPFEGLYAEAVNLGLVEELQRTCRICLAGPSTMAALLNSLQMGFKTLAIQKRSNEVWRILGEVRGEFEKFEEALSATQKHIRQVESDLEKLVGTRTRAINRKLDLVETGFEQQTTIL